MLIWRLVKLLFFFSLHCMSFILIPRLLIVRKESLYFIISRPDLFRDHSIHSKLRIKLVDTKLLPTTNSYQCSVPPSWIRKRVFNGFSGLILRDRMSFSLIEAESCLTLRHKNSPLSLHFASTHFTALRELVFYFRNILRPGCPLNAFRRPLARIRLLMPVRELHPFRFIRFVDSLENIFGDDSTPRSKSRG